MGYRLNRLDEPIFMAVPKPMLTEFGIHYILESCVETIKMVVLALLLLSEGHALAWPWGQG